MVFAPGQELLNCRRQRLLQCSHAEVAEELVQLGQHVTQFNLSFEILLSLHPHAMLFTYKAILQSPSPI